MNAKLLEWIYFRDDLVFVVTGLFRGDLVLVATDVNLLRDDLVLLVIVVDLLRDDLVFLVQVAVIERAK